MSVQFRLISTVLILMTILFSGPLAVAAIYTVRPDGSGDFPTIQAAINGAVAGDTIELTDGTFTGAGNRDLVLGKQLYIRAQAGPGGYCIIDCEADSGDPHRGISIDDGATGSRFEGITIQHTWVSSEGGAVRMYETLVIFDRCIFWLNHSDLGGGAFYAATGCDLEIYDCVLAGNATDQGGSGGVIWIDDGSAVTLHGCLLNDNWGDLGGTIYNRASSVSLFECTINESDGPQNNHAIVSSFGGECLIENSIIGFGTDRAVNCYDTATTVIYCSDVFGNEGGDWVDCIAGMSGVEGNISADPLYCWPYGAPFTLYNTSPCAPHISPCGQIGAKSVGCASTPQDAEEAAGEIRSLWLAQPSPNPARGGVSIGYALAADHSGADAALAVYDATGRLVRSLCENIGPASIGQLFWDRVTDDGRVVADGVYFVRLSAGNEVVIRQVTIIN